VRCATNEAMILVLAHHHDAEADWLLKALRRHGAAVLFLCPEALGVDYAVTLSLRNDGQHASEFAFFDATIGRITSDRISYAVNRLGFIDPLVWRSAQEGERTYASSEINAFFPALIESLRCRIDSPVLHGALWVDSGFALRWAARLRAHGVAVHRSMMGEPAEASEMLMASDPTCLRRWLWFEREVFAPSGQPPVPIDMARVLRMLAPRQTLEIVCVQGTDPSDLQLLHVSRSPALSCYGQSFVRALTTHAKGLFDDHPDGHPERAALAPAV
jgi:hypothetical protein